MQPTRIPLFPLDVVLFPDMRLPLHIFEPRYKQMIRYCVDSQIEFGVTLAKQEGLAAVGCTAATLHILRTYPDGQMDVETRGNLRYHLRRVYQEKVYFEADVEYLTDAKSAVSEGIEKELLEACDRCYELLQSHRDRRRPDNLSLFIWPRASPCRWTTSRNCWRTTARQSGSEACWAI